MSLLTQSRPTHLLWLERVRLRVAAVIQLEVLHAGQEATRANVRGAFIQWQQATFALLTIRYWAICYATLAAYTLATEDTKRAKSLSDNLKRFPE